MILISESLVRNSKSLMRFHHAKGKKRTFMFPNDRKRIIIHEVHKMLRSDSKAKVLAAHCGYKSIYQKIAE